VLYVFEIVIIPCLEGYFVMPFRNKSWSCGSVEELKRRRSLASMTANEQI